ncbi:MAG TPA: DinB family protein [Terriglobales bacterium]|nr:DinB family protein [Terriglobales bacterium]
MEDEQIKSLREHLLEILRGGGAHLTPDEVVESIPAALRGLRAGSFEHSPWELLEHMRIAQWDIYQFSINPKHKSPEWPEGYWPEKPAPASPAAWSKSVKQFLGDLRDMQQLVSKSSTDLFAPIPHGSGQTILREALLLADHNAYHLGQMVAVRKALEKV